MSDDQQSDRAVETLPNSEGSPSTARSDARLTKRIKYLQNELNGKSALIAKLSEDVATAQRQIADAGGRIKMLEAERDAALAEAGYQQKCFTQMITAMQIASSGEYDHLIPALRRREQTNARGES